MLKERLDGNVWNLWETEAKLRYVEGFIDGLFQGHCFTTWNLPSDGTRCYVEATTSYDFHSMKFVARVPADQFASGLDGFYLDAKNFQIKAKDGMWIVMNSIAGTPLELMTPMIETCRQMAAEGRD